MNHLTSAINALVLESPSRPTLPAALSTSNSLNNNVSSSSGVTNSPASNNNVSISSPPAAVATSPINNNSGAPPPHEPETPTQGRPADPQRARRSMRSVDDSARRRSARGSRNIMTQIPGRANGVSGRPAVDLPPGYGEFFFLNSNGNYLAEQRSKEDVISVYFRQRQSKKKFDLKMTT